MIWYIMVLIACIIYLYYVIREFLLDLRNDELNFITISLNVIFVILLVLLIKYCYMNL